MKTVELAAYLMQERKTIENLARKLREIVVSWGIEDAQISAVVSDGGSNIKGAGVW